MLTIIEYMSFTHGDTLALKVYYTIKRVKTKRKNK